jgi:hypothetical protein
LVDGVEAKSEELNHKMTVSPFHKRILIWINIRSNFDSAWLIY